MDERIDAVSHGSPPAEPSEAATDALAWELLLGLPVIPYRDLDDDDAATAFIGPQIEDALGYGVEEWLMQGDLWSELLHPDDRERVLARWDRCRLERVVFDARYRLIGADGRRVWFHDRARPMTLEDGTVVWHGVLVDITAERAHEERLEEERFVLEGTVALQEERIAEASALIDLEISERHAVEDDLRVAQERFEALRAATRESWVYTWDVVDGRAQGGFSSESALADFCADPAEVALGGADYWRAWLHPADVERVTAKIRTSTTTGEPFEDSYRWVTPDGRVRWILDRAVATAWDGATRRGTFVGLMVDVSDLMGRAISPEG
ncbi:MAG: PAS domain-containing protein [Actinomycetota bacterium]